MNYLAAYEDLYGLDGTALASNVYGPRQDPHGEAGSNSDFCRAAYYAEKSPQFFGTGEQTRDFVYVDDAVDAFIQASEIEGIKFCNIGTGIETSVNSLYQSMASLIGSSHSRSTFHLAQES